MSTFKKQAESPCDCSPAQLEVAEAAFKRAYPTYETTKLLDDLRVQEYARLDEQNQIYLDYTGGGLYADAQLRKHMALLSNGVFGNPHSENPTSLAMTHLDEYVAIFTMNASWALKLVGEAYPFSSDSQYLLTFDNHNSVNGIREFAHNKGANVTYLPVVPPNLRVDPDKLAD